MIPTEEYPPDVVPPERNLEEPPGVGDGEVLTVEMNRVDDRGEITQKACQECDEPVELSDTHVWARVKYYNAIGKTYGRPVFCDAQCWSEWARS